MARAVAGAVTVAAVVATVALGTAPAGRPSGAQARAAPARPPNVVVIVTDDQRFDSMRAMPIVRDALARHGVTFRQAIVSNPLCCPSRAALLLGAYSHTSLIYTNKSRTQPHGGWEGFRDTGDEAHTIALALHDAGYRTGLFGKYFNNFTGIQAPPGWDRFASFLAEWDGGAYYDYDMLVAGPAGSETVDYADRPEDYSTHVIGRMALSFLRETPATQPFLLYVTPFAPHGKVTPAPEDEGTFGGVDVVMRPNFNEADLSDKPGYIQAGSEVSEPAAQRRVRRVYETLASVDRMVGRIVGLLRTKQVLSQTAIVFLSDNGTLIGEHRWRYKMAPYEESIRVPMIVRYDPLTAPQAGTRTDALVSNVDIVPTIAALAGITYTGVGTIDGVSLVPLLDGSARSIRSQVLLEHMDFTELFPIPSYCGLRTPRWSFVRYATGEQELYDLRQDPYQMANAISERPELAESFMDRLRRACDPPPPGYAWG